MPYGDALRLGEAAHGLLDRFGIWINLKGVLGEFPGYTWHVGWTPGEDFPVLSEELDERAFLCGRQA